MKIKIAEATNRQLDYLMALSQGYTVFSLDYTIDHALTGPLIDKYRLGCAPDNREGWCAFVHERLFEDDGTDGWSTGPTRLIAACRCIVTKHFGAEAEVPEDLT